jgi:ubiquinol-cytochrome c reductase cytochrome b subunit
VFDRLYTWFDDRLRVSHFTRSALNKIFPDNWSFMLGEIALYSFLVLVLTGVYLTLFFRPSTHELVYGGHYVPLRGLTMSEAFESTVRLSFDVRAGLVFRQIHHWAALVFLAAIVLHLSRVFFTGAFRRPREANWIVGVTLLILAILNGFAGYSLPDDLLSGTGLRIAFSILLSVPVLGTWAAFLVFGGKWPTQAIIPRLYIVHVFIVPLLILALVSVHMAILWRQKHTEFPGPGRSEKTISGSKLWPTYAARSIGLFFGVLAVLSALGGLAQINPIWLYGPYKPAAVSTAAQPDWYMGWIEGALRLFPGWRIHIFGHVISEVFWPAVVLPLGTFALLYAWPFLEQRVTGEATTEHHLLDFPRQRPVRTAIGAGAFSFYVVLFVAGSQDVLASKLHVQVGSLTWSLRALGILLPPVVAVVTFKLCRERRAEKARHEEHDAPPAPEGNDATASPRDRPASPTRKGVPGVALGALATAGAFVAGLWRGRRRRTRVVVVERDRG